MGALWLPSDDELVVAQREPNLLVPGRKPVGQIASDKDVLFSRLRGVTHVEGYLEPTGSVGSILQQVGPNGLADSVTASGGALAFNHSRIKVTSGPFTIVAHLHVAAYSSTNNRIYNASDAITSPYAGVSLMYRGQTGEWWYQFGDYATATAKKTSSETGDIVVVGRTMGAVNDIWVNGVKGSGATYNAFSYSSDNYTPTFNGYHSTVPVSQGLQNGLIYSLTIIREGLSDAEILALSKNQYTIYKPANQSPFLISIPATYPTLSAVEAAAYSASSITPRCDIEYP